jgi:hypothetical protein
VPHTPFSPGEPVSPRDDEPGWFEPVAPNLMIEPTDQEDEWSAASDSAERGRESIAWREVRWVEFGDPDESSENREPASAGTVEPAATAVSGPDAPASDATDANFAEQAGTLRRRIAAGIARLFRLGGVAVSLVLAAIFLYKGG